MDSINRSNVAGAFRSRKGITVNCQNPYPLENAVLSLIKYHFPVYAFQVQCRELLRSSQRIKGVVNIWGRKAVLFLEIQSSVVYAETKAVVFLPDERHRR